MIDVLSGLSELIESSLVRVTDGDRDELRYSMLIDRLTESEDRLAIERRHAEWVRDLFEDADPHLVLHDLRAWQARLRREEENLRMALRWAIAHEQTEVGFRLVGACWRYWFYWAASVEGITWVDAVLTLPGAKGVGETRARALSSRAALRWNQGRGAESLDAYLEVLDILRALDIEDERFADALDDAAWAAKLTGDDDLAVRLTEEKWHYPIRVASPYFHSWISREEDIAMRTFQHGPGPDARLLDAVERARAAATLTDQALFAANATASAGGFQRVAGNLELALAHGREALRLYRDLGHLGRVPIILMSYAAEGKPCRRPRSAGRASSPPSRGLLAAYPGALSARSLRSLDLPVRGGGTSLGVQPEPDGLIRPLWIVKLPAVRRGAVLIEAVDRAIGTEDEPATVRDLEFSRLESPTLGRGGPWGLTPAELVSHCGSCPV